MFENCDKSHSNVSLMSKRNMQSKRNLEENDNNYGNNHWIESSFNNNNNKRAKADNRWTPLLSQSNRLTTNSSALNPNPDLSVNMEDEDDLLNDGLDDYISQVVDETQYTSGHSSDNSVNHSQQMVRTSDQNMSSQATAMKSEEDITMNTITNPSTHESNSSSEASEGRLKILESRNVKLTEEILKFKTQNIQSQHKIRELEEYNKRKADELFDKYESALKFERNEKQYQAQLVVQLQSALKALAPNAAIVQTTAEYLNQRKKAFRQDFSQIKLQEFYEGLPSICTSRISSIPSQSQSTPLTGGDILVPESQFSVGGKRAKFSSSFPSQISSTQMLDSSMHSMPQPMDTQSGGSNERTVRESDSSQTGSQTQNSKVIWNPIRVILEHKFCSDQNQLNQFFGPHNEFDDQWIRDNQEINNWTTSLNQLAEELGHNLQLIVKF